jgi:hypothetical protein
MTMAIVECKSVQRGIPSKWVEIDCLTDDDVRNARSRLDAHLVAERQPSDAVALAFLELAEKCPAANPSDLWQHVIYRSLLDLGWSDQRWKRVSGFALERAFALHYEPRLRPWGIRMHILPSARANALLDSLGLAGIRATKVDLFIEGRSSAQASGGISEAWAVFGAAHVKSSIAERIQDDVPASVAFQQRRLMSIALTMDAKSFPPPHGDCVNYGELGGRNPGDQKERQKRGYIETTGQFDGLFSFNLRTPPSPATTLSGKRIYTMSLHDPAPDQLVRFLIDAWANHKAAIPI